MSKKKSEEPKLEPKLEPKPLSLDSAKGMFVDGFGIASSKSKESLTLSFVTLIQNEPYVFSRIVLTPTAAKTLADSINKLLEKMKTSKRVHT